LGIFCCIACVVYLGYFGIDHLVQHGPAGVDWMFDDTKFDAILWLGSCAYVYEGINCVLPIFEAAQKKENVPKLLVSIIGGITLLYIAFGVLFYTAFGSETKSVAMLNLPLHSIAGKILPGMFVLVGVVSIPIQSFMAFQIIEQGMKFSERSLVRKWQKNFSRSVILILVTLVTWLGGTQLENFLALVGGFGCSSLAMVVPALMHIRICKPSWLACIVDCFLVFVGFLVLVISTGAAMITWH